jgi:hypothetical protein
VHAIGADDPMRLELEISANDSVRMQASHWRVPEELDPGLMRPFSEQALQRCPFYARSVTGREIGGYATGFVTELDTPKRASFAGRNANAEASKPPDGIRHQPFAAGLVDGRMPPVENDGSEPQARSFDSGC